jgi:hypothetical protein
VREAPAGTEPFVAGDATGFIRAASQALHDAVTARRPETELVVLLRAYAGKLEHGAKYAWRGTRYTGVLGTAAVQLRTLVESDREARLACLAALAATK